MTEKKSLIKNTATLYVRMLVSMLIGFFTSRILLNQLGVVDFGVYNVVGSIIVLLGFLNSTLSLSTQRFINIELGNNDYDKLQKVFSSSLVIHFALALVVFIFAETAGLWFLNSQLNIPDNRIVAANYVYQFTVLSSLFTLTVIPYSATIIAHEHMSQYATIGIIDIFLRFGIACMLYLISSDKLVVYTLALLFVIAINYLIYFLYCKKHFKECRFKLSKDKQLYVDMLTFSGWNIFSSISIVLNGQVVGIILNMFFGPIINASRGISTQVNGSISGFVSNFQIAVNPRIIQSYAKKDLDEFFKLINQSAKFSFYLLLIFVVPFWINIEPILELWLGTVPEYTADFCRIVFISSLLNTFSLPLATAANANGSIKVFQIACGVFELMNIPMSYVLLKLGYPPVSVYFIQLAIVIITLFVRLMVLRKLVNMNCVQFLVKIVIRCLIVAILSFNLSYLATYQMGLNSFWNVLVSLVLSGCFTIGLITIVGVDKNERMVLMFFLKSKLYVK